MLFRRPRSFRVHTWTPDHVIITGAYWGWSGILFPIATIAMLPGLLVFLFSKWVVIALLLVLIAGFGARFKLIIHRNDMVLHASFLGFTFLHDIVPTDSNSVQLGFDWDRIAPPDVEVGPHAIGDETNAMSLFHTIQAAIAHVGADLETKAAHLGLATPVTAAPTEEPVEVAWAMEVIERYQRLKLEVLMVKGWVLDGSTRISLYVVHESCSLVFDAYIRTAQIPELEKLRPTPAEDDEMALTARRRFVWTPSPFRLWQNGSPIASLSSEVFWTLKGGSIPRENIVSVKRWLSKNWLKMGVDVEVRQAKPVQVASGFNRDVGLDMFYDGIDLMFDVEWVESITRILAHELDVNGIEDH